MNFGVVARGQTPTQTIEVEYAGNLDWKVSDVVVNTAPYSVTFHEMYRRPGQVGYKIEATLKADAPAGAFKHEIFLKTNDPASSLVPMTLEANVQATLSVTPSTLRITNVKVGEPVTPLVRLQGARPFRVR